MKEVLAGIGEIPEHLKHIPTLSPSRLYDFMKSPKYYKHINIDGNKKETDAMIEGRMVHCYNLEPHKFDQQYVNPFVGITPLKTVEDLKGFAAKNNIDLKGCKKKEDYEAAILTVDPSAPVLSRILADVEKKGLIVYDERDMEMLKEINRESREHQWLGKAMQGGTFEQLMWYYDDVCELIWRFKPDYFHQALGKHKIPCVIDWKKMPSTNPEAFNAWLYNSKSFVQFAIYKEGLKKIFNIDACVAVAGYDTAPPYAVEAYEVDVGAVDAGLAIAKKKGMEFRQCLETNHWPTAGGGKLLSGTLPTWAFNRIDFQEDQALEA